jgi:hypothetical protein
MKGSKTINAGMLIENILQIAEIKGIKFEYLTEQEIEEILFSLGFPCSEGTLNIEW